MRADLSETWVPYNSEFMARTWKARARLQARLLEARRLANIAAERPSVLSIIARVAGEHGYTVEQVLAYDRRRGMVACRQAAMVEAYLRRPDLSFLQIARVFRRDHTTILHAVQKLGAVRRQK